MRKLFYLLIIGIFLTGCLKEELPVTAPSLGNGESTIEQVKIGQTYQDHLYYSLEKEEVVLRVNRNVWDLAFETTAEGFHVLINNSRAGGLRKTNKTEFDKVMNDNTTDWGYDSPTWDMDSTFLGDWRNESFIYVFFRGVDADGVTEMEKYKFRVVDVDETSYKIEYCLLNQTTPIQAIIPKHEDYQFSLFSFVTGEDVTEQGMPKNKDYDICFRTYTYIYPDGIPYLVVGCLLNPSMTSAVEVTSKTNFNDVNYEDAMSSTFSNHVDEIGFEWKEYGFDVTYYTVYPEKIYIVKTQNDRYYKLHFLDYYDNGGVKGSPKFEFQELLP